MKPVLSICMMVKDEEKNLQRCLLSLQPIIKQISSELIIVDTGSSDRTVEIAKQFTDRVFYHPWNHNFAEMRNITIGYAQGEWVFIVDADEELTDCAGILQFFSKKQLKKIAGAALLVKSLTSDNSEQFVSLMSPRIFRKTPDFHYEGSVHNNPVSSGLIVDTGDILMHYGYISTDKELMDKKFQRTSKLLQAELEKDPANIYYRFQLAVTYAMHNDKVEALREIEKAYLQYRHDDVTLKKNIYVFGRLLHCYVDNARTGDDVISAGEHGLRLEPEYIDLYFFMAQVYLLRNDLKNAYEYYSKHLDLVNRFYTLEVKNNLMINHYTLNSGSEALFNMAAICAKLEQYNNARSHAEDLLQKEKNNTEYQRKIRYLLLDIDFRQGEFATSRNIYQEYVVAKCYEEAKMFEAEAEKYWKAAKAEVKQIYCQAFNDAEGLYGHLNRVRLTNTSNIATHEVKEFLQNAYNYDFNQLPDYYAPLLKLVMAVCPLEIPSFTAGLTEGTLLSYIKYLDELDRKVFLEVCLSYLDAGYSDDLDQNDFYLVRIKKNIGKYLLFSGVLSDTTYQQIFEEYIIAGKQYIAYLYSKMVIDQELIYDLKNVEEAFLLYLLCADIHASNDNDVLAYFKKALQIYPAMGKGIQILLGKLDDANNDNQMNQLVDQLLNNVRLLIDNREFDEALIVLNECTQIVGDDMRLLAIKSEIYRKRLEN